MFRKMLKRILLALLPRRAFISLKWWLSRRSKRFELTAEELSEYYPMLKKKAKQSSNQLKEGVNLIGYARSEIGLGEACRNNAAALSTIKDLDWSIYDIRIGDFASHNDYSWSSKFSDSIEYKVSIININADGFPMECSKLPIEFFNTYKIGIWYWELENFPEEWDYSFNLVDELWAPTHFIEEAMKRKAKCPVLYMPTSTEPEEPPKMFDRKFFNLPEDAFLFFMMYDKNSTASRKNPQAAINAFKKSFSPNDMTVGLVIKVNNALKDDDEFEKLKGVCGEYQNIFFISGTLPRIQVNALLKGVDVAISLHRSEGLGLLCMEAMYFGKPVIATNWSGNTDFMNKNNSCMVDYRMVKVADEDGPYRLSGNQFWAEADVEQAASFMSKLKSDKEFYNQIAMAGKKTILDVYSHNNCGERMNRRIREILKEL